MRKWTPHLVVVLFLAWFALACVYAWALLALGIAIAVAMVAGIIVETWPDDDDKYDDWVMWFK